MCGRRRPLCGKLGITLVSPNGAFRILSSILDRPVFRLWGKGGWSDDQNRTSYVH